MTAGSSAARRVRPLLIALFALSAGAASPGAAQDIEERVALCATCHGEDGRPSEADIPIIWRQEFYYLYVQLKDFKAGRRSDPVMSAMAAPLSEQDAEDLAAWFASQKQTPGSADPGFMDGRSARLFGPGHGHDGRNLQKTHV